MSKTDHTQAFSLQVARLNKGLSIRQAARAAGVAQETFRRLEKGLPVYPAKAKRVADYFEVQVTDLMPPEAEKEAA
jgi:transcriptional regulator with XRE-family HTH domain